MNFQSIQFITPSLVDVCLRVAKGSGYPEMEAVPRIMKNEIMTAAQHVISILQPEAVFSVLPVNEITESRIISDAFVVESKRWAALALGCDSPHCLYPFLLSLGRELDISISEMQDRSMTQAFLMDAAGTVLAEEYARQIEWYISDLTLHEGLCCSARFSPGYCDWDTGKGQEQFKKISEASSVDVSVLPSGMMVPQKSISGVLIAAKSLTITTPCKNCRKFECPYRR